MALLQDGNFLAQLFWFKVPERAEAKTRSDNELSSYLSGERWLLKHGPRGHFGTGNKMKRVLKPVTEQFEER